MSFIDMAKQDYLRTIRDHKRELKFADAHEASQCRKPNGLSLEAEQVLSQVDESIFCVADLDNPCDCPSCQKYEAESRADALATYVPKVDEDDHSDEPCDDPHCGCHCDCEVNECMVCFERAQDRAENAMDAARDEEMGL